MIISGWIDRDVSGTQRLPFPLLLLFLLEPPGAFSPLSSSWMPLLNFGHVVDFVEQAKRASCRFRVPRVKHRLTQLRNFLRTDIGAERIVLLYYFLIVTRTRVHLVTNSSFLNW